VPLKSPIHACKASDCEHDRKHNKDKTASPETTQSPSSWRRVNPTVHIF
jgi:hypothetical protein